MTARRRNQPPPEGPVGLPPGYPHDPPLRLLDAVMLGRLAVDERMSDSVHEALTREIQEAQMAVVVVRRLDGKPRSPAARQTPTRRQPRRREHTEPILP